MLLVATWIRPAMWIARVGIYQAFEDSRYLTCPSWRRNCPSSLTVDKPNPCNMHKIWRTLEWCGEAFVGSGRLCGAIPSWKKEWNLCKANGQMLRIWNEKNFIEYYECVGREGEHGQIAQIFDASFIVVNRLRNVAVLTPSLSHPTWTHGQDGCRPAHSQTLYLFSTLFFLWETGQIYPATSSTRCAQ